MTKSPLITQLQTIPEFTAFCKALQQNLQPDNCYVADNMPEADSHFEEWDENGRLICYPSHFSTDQRLEMAVEKLLDDHGDDFDEFVHCDGIRNAVTELVRVRTKECLKCGIV